MADELITGLLMMAMLGLLIAFKYIEKRLIEHGEALEQATLVDPGMPGDPNTPLGYEGTKALYGLDDPEAMEELERLLARDPHMVLTNGMLQYRKLGGNDSIRGITGDPNPDNPIGISKCPYCDRKVDRKKDACPGCGAPY